MDLETLKTKYPEIINIKTKEQAKKWLKILSPEEQKVIKARWEISSEEEKKEPEKDSQELDEEQKNKLNDYKSFAENPPDDTKAADDFLERHKNDNIPPEKVEKSGLDLGGVKEIRSKPPINRLTAFKSLVKNAPMKIKEYFSLHQLNDEALPNIQSKSDELQKDIEEKWKLIQDELPEAKGFKTEDEFKKWASNLPPEQKKSLQDKWLTSGNSGIISLNDAYAYKRVSELGKDNLAKKTPNLIFKLYTQFFHPKPTTSAITKQGKTNEEYSKQFDTQSSSTKKSILRHEKKLTKQRLKTKRRERKERIGKKPTGYREKFKQMYTYLFGDNLKNTPKGYAAANVASQEYNKSKKKYDPIWAAVVVEELAELAPPPPYYEPSSYEESTTEPHPPDNEDITPSTHSPSNLQQRLRNLQGQNSDNHDNPLHPKHSSEYKKAAKKLRKAHKASKGTLKKNVKKKPWYLKPNCRSLCCLGSCFEILVVLFIAVLIFAVIALILGFLN